MSYGLSYSDYFGLKEINRPAELPDLDFNTDILGSAIGFNIAKYISKKYALGFGYTRHQHARNLTKTISFFNTFMQLENFRAIDQSQFFDVHVKRNLTNNFRVSLGLFYYLFYYNTFNLYFDNNNVIYNFQNDKQRTDNFGISLGLEYYFPVKSYLDIGVRSKANFDLAGFDSLLFSPAIRIKL